MVGRKEECMEVNRSSGQDDGAISNVYGENSNLDFI